MLTRYPSILTVIFCRGSFDLNMDDNTEQKKTLIMKSLAVFGFIGILIAIAWLSVQFVQFIPSAFSSLASLAGSLQESKTDIEETKNGQIVITSDITTVSAGEIVEITWQNLDRAGSYIFSYDCTDGVAVDILNVDGIQSIACDTNYNVGNRNNLSMVIDLEKGPETILNYTLSFLGTNDITSNSSVVDSLVIKNDEIEIIDDVAKVQDPNEDIKPEPDNSEKVVETKPIIKPVVPVATQQYVYTTPVSDPNGRTDLAVRFIQTGTIVGKTFFSGPIARNNSGAIQFEIKNHGTKTSHEWSYTVTLPDGSDYEAKNQVPLKPNEKAVITVGFPTDNSSSYTFKVTVDEPTDKTYLNDRFEQRVFFTR